MRLNIKYILPLSLMLFSSALQAQETTIEEMVEETAGKKTKSVQIAYKSVDSEDLVGSVSQIDMDEINKKNYTTNTFSSLQGYIGGWNGSSMWGLGSDYMVLVDGVLRDETSLTPNEIESISFLKGPSAAVLYGSHAAEGVIYIKTKRGRTGDLKVSARINSGMQMARDQYPDYLGSAEYMTLYNQARINDGASPLYNEEEIYKYASGVNPYMYPNVNFYSDEFINNYYNRTNAIVELEGGNERATFYTNVGYTHNDSFLNFGEAAKNGNNRFNMRNNLDMRITNFLTAKVNTSVILADQRSAHGNYWGQASSMRPNEIAPLIPISAIDPSSKDLLRLINTSNIIDGKYFLGGTQPRQTNIFADYSVGGYNTNIEREFQFDASVTADLASVTKGLTFSLQYAIDYDISYDVSYNNKYSVFEPTWSSHNGVAQVVALKQYGTDERSGVQNVNNSANHQTMALNAHFDYNRSFGKHNISSMLIASGFQETFSKQYHKPSSTNMGFNLSYNYDHRMYVDFNAAAVYSPKYAQDKRVALSPSLTLAYRPLNKDFVKRSSTFDDLLISVSASGLNTDIYLDGYFYSDDVIFQNSSSNFSWNDGNYARATLFKSGGNPNLTYTKLQELSANVKASLWKKSLVLDASAYVMRQQGLPIIPANIYPSYFNGGNSSFVPYANIDDNRITGFDVAANFNQRINDFEFSLGLTASYFLKIATERNEIYEDEYQSRIGKSVGAVWGLVNDGFFKDQADIDASPSHTYAEVKPGDLKYVDQNADNIIDDKDQVYLGRNGSPITVGANLTAKYKGFTLFALFTGRYGAYAMKSGSYWWVSGNGKYSDPVRGSWTPETAATATYPRLTTGSGTNNYRNSSFWIYSTNRFDLAKVQLTYDFALKNIEDNLFKGLSIYASGSNLFTIAPEKDIMLMNVGSAPATRFVNLGIVASF